MNAPRPVNAMARRLRQRRTVYLLPNLFTAGSLFCALAAVVQTSEGNFINACYLILLSGILDMLDGPVARITRSASSFGLQFDSLADVVAFGLAPAYLMYAKLAKIEETVTLPERATNLALGACALFLISGAIRLARFNVQVTSEERRHFTGLPIPAAAAAVVSAFLFVEAYLDDSLNLHRAILLLMVLMSFLMVSTIPFPKLVTMLRPRMRSIDSLIFVVFVVCLVLALRSHLPALLLAGIAIYIVGSIGAYVRSRKSGVGGVATATGPKATPDA